MKICVVGAGFVGVATAISLVERGHDVTLVERDSERLGALRRSVVLFHEPGVPDALTSAVASGFLHFRESVGSAQASEIVFLCVGTPKRPDGGADLTEIIMAAESVGEAICAWGNQATVVVKSTVPPGTCRDVVLSALQKTVGDRARYGLASNPEFLREGTALRDARQPDRVVIGVADGTSRAALGRLYESETSPVIVTTLETAEAIKYASNAMLAVRIAFANEMANLAETIDVNVDDVMVAIGLDRRIGPLFLKAGAGFGGSCLPKDVAALSHFARARGVEMGVIEAALANNQAQPLRLIQMAEAALGELRGARIALLGLSFKPDTSDVRESRALVIHQALVDRGARVICYDPVAASSFKALATAPVEVASSLCDALVGADACIVHTEWPEFRALPPADYIRLMRRPVVLDGRRWLDAKSFREAGADYRAIGLGGGLT